MKDFDKAIEAINANGGNILVVGGECSGKSKLLELLTAYMIGQKDVFIMSNSNTIRGLTNLRPDSTFIYKSKGQEINDSILANIEQNIVIVDEYTNFEQLTKHLNIDKRLIMTYHADNINEIPEAIKKYFGTIIICEIINEETKEKGITNIIYN